MHTCFQFAAPASSTMAATLPVATPVAGRSDARGAAPALMRTTSASAAAPRMPKLPFAAPLAPAASRKFRAHVSRAAVVSMAVPMKCLIVNCKSGGHAFIGLYLARALMAKGHSVTILNDGDASKLSSKGPFAKYKELEAAGAKVVWGSPTKPSSYPAGSFDVVYDNNGKDIDTCRPLIDAYRGKVQHYVFVSSAGMYKADAGQPMSLEGDKRAEKDHFYVEEYLKQVKMPYTIFRPLYIYGPDSAKDYQQWMMDRILRDRPVCIPSPGIQCTSMTHVEDVASMLACVPGNEAAIGQDFNAGSDRTVTFVGMAKAIAKAAGKEAKVVLYEPEKLGLGKGAKVDGFPFRAVHFFASSAKAKRMLGWTPKHDFMSDVPALVELYKKEGRMNKKPDFTIDDKILAATKSSGGNGPSSGSSSSAATSSFWDAQPTSSTTSSFWDAQPTSSTTSSFWDAQPSSKPTTSFWDAPSSTPTSSFWDAQPSSTAAQGSSLWDSFKPTTSFWDSQPSMKAAEPAKTSSFWDSQSSTKDASNASTLWDSFKPTTSFWDSQSSTSASKEPAKTSSSSFWDSPSSSTTQAAFKGSSFWDSTPTTSFWDSQPSTTSTPAKTSSFWDSQPSSTATQGSSSWDSFKPTTSFWDSQSSSSTTKEPAKSSSSSSWDSWSSTKEPAKTSSFWDSQSSSTTKDASNASTLWDSFKPTTSFWDSQPSTTSKEPAKSSSSSFWDSQSSSTTTKETSKGSSFWDTKPTTSFWDSQSSTTTSAEPAKTSSFWDTQPSSKGVSDGSSLWDSFKPTTSFWDSQPSTTSKEPAKSSSSSFWDSQSSSTTTKETSKGSSFWDTKPTTSFWDSQSSTTTSAEPAKTSSFWDTQPSSKGVSDGSSLWDSFKPTTSFWDSQPSTTASKEPAKTSSSSSFWDSQPSTKEASKTSSSSFWDTKSSSTSTQEPAKKTPSFWDSVTSLWESKPSAASKDTAKGTSLWDSFKPTTSFWDSQSSSKAAEPAKTSSSKTSSFWDSQSSTTSAETSKTSSFWDTKPTTSFWDSQSSSSTSSEPAKTSSFWDSQPSSTAAQGSSLWDSFKPTTSFWDSQPSTKAAEPAKTSSFWDSQPSSKDASNASTLWDSFKPTTSFWDSQSSTSSTQSTAASSFWDTKPSSTQSTPTSSFWDAKPTSSFWDAQPSSTQSNLASSFWDAKPTSSFWDAQPSSTQFNLTSSFWDAKPTSSFWDAQPATSAQSDFAAAASSFWDTTPGNKGSSMASSAFGASAGAASTKRTARVLNVRKPAPAPPMKCLIVNCKSGGHAFIGLYLARALMAKGHSVTILNDGDASKLSSKGPFAKYKELEAAGAKVVWGSPTKPSSYPAGSFDVVYDNNGKDIDTCRPLIDAYRGKVQHYVFVSSAGMYKADAGQPMSLEGDKRAEKDHFYVEEYLKQVKMPYTIFRPLYIYGPDSAKDYQQWMMDRILRDRPVCIPSPGIQCTSMTHVEDVASMLACVPGNEAAIGQDFNACSDRTVTFVGMAKAIAKAAGKEAKVVLYEPEKLGLGKGAKVDGFPFRAVHFFASSSKAQRLLGWTPQHDFLSDVPALVELYKKEGRMNKQPDFTIDDKILAATKSAVLA